MATEPLTAEEEATLRRINAEALTPLPLPVRRLLATLDAARAQAEGPSVADERERLALEALHAAHHVLATFESSLDHSTVEWAEARTALNAVNSALDATPTPAEGRQAVREAEGIDVERLANAMQFGVAWEAVPSGNQAWRVVAGKVAREYAALQADAAPRERGEGA